MLADALWTRVQHQQEPIDTNDVKHVLDGGALLHRLLWPGGQTYSDVFKMYADYVTQKYGNPLIVFDGYQQGSSTKDVTHRIRRRTGLKMHLQLNLQKI